MKNTLGDMDFNLKSFNQILIHPENYKTFCSLLSILLSEFAAAMKHLETEENVRIELERDGVRRNVQEIVAGFQILNDKPCEVFKLPHIQGECQVKKTCKPKLMVAE